MRIRKAWFGDLFTVLILFLSTGAFTTVFLAKSSDETYLQGSPGGQVLWSSIYFVALLRAIPIRHRILAALKTNRALVALLLLTGASFCWSADPVLTARRSISLILGTIFAVDFAIRYPVVKQIRLVTSAVSTAIVLSAVVELFFPALVPPAFSGAAEIDTLSWNGLFTHKNQFGHILAFGVLCIIANFQRKAFTYIKTVACLVMVFALIAASQSRTSLIISIILLIQWPFLHILRWRQRTVRTIGVAATLSATLVVAGCFAMNGVLASKINRTTDLTGRTNVWDMALQSAAKRPILGYGYNGFWGITYESDHISHLLGWVVPTAHNGYLDVFIQLGLTGVLLFAGLAIMGVLRAAQFARNSGTPESLWPLASMLLILYYATTESYFLTSNSFTWFLFVGALISTNTRNLRYSREQQLTSGMQEADHYPGKDNIAAHA